MEEFILGLFDGASSVEYDVIIIVLIGLFTVFWSIVLYWAWLDSGLRTTNKPIRVLTVFLILFLNIIGLIIYLIVRPSQTIEEIYWADLERRYLKYETSELGDCPKCAYQLKPGFVQCPNCAYELKVKCKECGVWIDKDWNSCAYCGEENMYKRRRKDKEEVSQDQMEEQVQAAKDTAAETVEKKKTRYASRSGVVSVAMGSIKEKLESLKDKGFVSKPKPKKKKVVKRKVVKKKPVKKKKKRNKKK